MAKDLFKEHEKAKSTQERKQADYLNSLTEINAEKSTHKNGTPAVEKQHHGKAASEGRKK